MKDSSHRRAAPLDARLCKARKAPIVRRMSTAELARMIDERTPEERAWMAEYLRYLERPRKVRDATPEESARLAPLIRDMEARRNCLTQEEWDARMDALDRAGK